MFRICYDHQSCSLRFESGTQQYRYFFRSLVSCFKNNFSAKQIVRAGLCCGVFFPWQCMLYSKHVQKTAQVFIATIFLFQIAVPENLMSLRCRNALCTWRSPTVYMTQNISLSQTCMTVTYFEWNEWQLNTFDVYGVILFWQ